MASALPHRPTPLTFPSDFNVARWFIDRHRLEGRGEKAAILSDQETVTYADLERRVNRCAHALLAQGLKRGDRVLMAIKDSPAFFYIFWGSIKAGLIPVPLNTLLRQNDYAFLITNSECAAFLYSPPIAGEVEPALARVAHRPSFTIKVDETTAPALFDHGPDTFDAVPAGPNDDCFWLYSSGSTGQPKGAIHRHRDMVVTSENYGVQTLGISEDDRCFSAAKLFFAYGLGNGMTFPLWVGATSILLAERPTAEATFAVIEDFRPTLYFGVPTLYASQLQAMDRRAPDLSSLRLCISAGEALPADIFRRWREETGLVILDGIGSTEALHIFISNRIDEWKPGSSGRLVPGYQARILDDDDRELPPGTPGRLVIRGDSIARAYWRDPDKTAATMVDGWLNTGDTYSRDEDGTFYYHGRSDDMLKVGGIWCSPFEIEGALIEHPAVLEAAVVGRADADGLVKPEAWVVLDDATRPTSSLEDDLKAHCKQRLAPYKYPRRFRFIDELPKTATGKIQRFRLRNDDGA